MKKIRLLVTAIFVFTVISTMCAGAYSATNKVAKLYKESSNSNIEYRYLKMQATYNYSLADRMNGNNQSIIRVHMGVREDLQYYSQVIDPTRNGTLVNTTAINWTDSRDPEAPYRTREYFVHYKDRSATYNVTFLAKIRSSMVMTNTLSQSKCRYWTGQFYGSLGDSPIAVQATYNDAVRPSDYYTIR